VVKPAMGLCIALAPERITPLDGSGSPPEEERPADGRSSRHRPAFESPPGYQQYLLIASSQNPVPDNLHSGSKGFADNSF